MSENAVVSQCQCKHLVTCVECPTGKYGSGCELDCPCEVGASCDRKTGLCRCPPGTFGPTCAERCPGGRFGRDCAQTCRCRGPSTVQCDAVTGQCSCSPGFTGDSCQRRELATAMRYSRLHIRLAIILTMPPKSCSFAGTMTGLLPLQRFVIQTQNNLAKYYNVLSVYFFLFQLLLSHCIGPFCHSVCFLVTVALLRNFVSFFVFL